MVRSSVTPAWSPFCYERIMKLGAVFPTNEIGNDPAAIRDWVQTAEGLGYDQVIAYDHVVGAVHADREPPLWGPYTEADPFHEPFVLFGFMAALTTTIELVTGIIIAPQRQTVLLAKQAVQVDVLSGGRMVLGLGTGWNPVEYEALGIPFESRGRRLTEQIEVMRELFRNPVVDLTTREHRVDRAGLLPMPTRDIPIWLGGGSEPSLKRAAQLGDGFVFGSAGKRTRGQLARLHELLAENDRSTDGYLAHAIADYCAGPESWVAERDAWEASGGTHLAVQTQDIIYRWRGVGTPNGFTTPAAHIAALEHFATAMRS
jgi:probable F420-dependent oxidoreductase